MQEQQNSRLQKVSFLDGIRGRKTSQKSGSLRSFSFLKLQVLGFAFNFSKKVAPLRSQSLNYQQSS